MPVRRRVDRRKAGEAKAWSGYFYSGYDFFDQLADVGLTEDTAWPLAEETWHRIGREVMAYLDELHVGFPPYERPIWAEEQFGPPSGRRRHGSK